MHVFSELQTYDFGEASYRYYGHYGPVQQADIHLTLMYSGTGQATIDGVSRAMPEGEMCFAFIEQSIEYTYPAHEEHRVAWCRTSTPILSDVTIRRLKKLPYNITATNRFKALMEMGLNLGYDDDANQFALRNSIAQTLFYEYFNEAKLVEEDKPLPEPVKRTIKYVENNIREDCKLSILASASGITPQYLSKLFLKHMGQTPTQYVWQIRLQRSINMLANSQISIVEIAARSGFKNQQHFTRYIKQYCGKTPKQLREENLKIERV